MWVVKHRKHARTAVEIWLKELCKAGPARKLTLLFLSNDIVQNSRKKGMELNREFSKVMTKALQISYKDEDYLLTQGESLSSVALCQLFCRHSEAAVHLGGEDYVPR